MLNFLFFRWYPQFIWPLELIQRDQSAQLWRNARSIFISHAAVRKLQRPALTRPLGEQLVSPRINNWLETLLQVAFLQSYVESRSFVSAAAGEHGGCLYPKCRSGYYQRRPLTFSAFDLLFSACLSSAGEASEGGCRCFFSLNHPPPPPPPLKIKPNNFYFRAALEMSEWINVFFCIRVRTRLRLKIERFLFFIF